jgi:hypothetical protein
LKVAGTSFRCKAEKPITEILHVLEDVDLHPKSLYSSLKVKIREDESAARVGVKLQLKHVPATALSPQRPSIILSPGTRFFTFLLGGTFLLRNQLMKFRKRYARTFG